MEINFSFIKAINKYNPLYIKYYKSLQKYINSINIPSSSTIILCGSFAKNTLREHSDIDIIFIHNSIECKNECFKKIEMNGIVYDQFQISKDELLSNFANEKNSINRQQSSLLSSGTYICGDKSLAKFIIAEAIKAYNYIVPPIKLEDAQSMINFIQSRFPHEMKALFNSTKVGFFVTLNNMMERYYKIIHQIEGILQTRYEDIDNTFSIIQDRKCANLFCNVLLKQNYDKKMKAFENLPFLISKKLEKYIKENYLE